MYQCVLHVVCTCIYNYVVYFKTFLHMTQCAYCIYEFIHVYVYM